MTSRRKTSDLASQQFYKFDKWLLTEKKLKKLSANAKLLYMVLRDREELSLKNAKAFTDKDGCLFQYFDQNKASELLGISKNAIIKAFKDLQEYKLIESVRQGLGKPNRLYILNFEISEDTLKELSYEKKKADTVAPVPTNNNIDNKKIDIDSISQSKEEYNPNLEKNKKSEIIEVIDDSCVNIRKQDLEKCEEEFTDIKRLKKALSICEINDSHGIKALRMAYKYGDKNDTKKKQSTLFMADTKIEVGEKIKCWGDMTEEEINRKIMEKNSSLFRY